MIITIFIKGKELKEASPNLGERFSVDFDLNYTLTWDGGDGVNVSIVDENWENPKDFDSEDKGLAVATISFLILQSYLDKTIFS